MDSREKTILSLHHRFLALLVAGILILVNVLSLRSFVRFDITANGQYTISDASVSILEKLDDLVTAKVYFSEDLPAQLVPSSQYIRDLLGEYQAFSSGNFEYEIIDPALDVDAAQEAARVGVNQVQMSVVENDNYQVKAGYFGMTLFYEGKHESIPVFQQDQLGNLEYDISSRILKLAQTRDYRVGFLQGHGEHQIGDGLLAPGQSPDHDYSAVRKILSDNYLVDAVDFSAGDSLEGLDVIVVAGPKRDLTERAIFELDQYLLQGGNAVFLVDAVENIQGITVEPLETNVRTLFSSLGVTVEPQLVLDSLNELTNFNAGPSQFFVLPYPPFVRFVSQNFSSHPIVTKVQGFTGRFISPVTVEDKLDILTYDRFINSSPKSWVQSSPYQITPNQIPQPSQEDVKSSPVGVYVTGPFPRLTDVLQVPVLQKWTEKNDSPGEYELVPVTTDPRRSGREVLQESSAPARLILMSDSDFITDQSLQNDQSGLIVFLNMIDYLTFGEELVSIRSKQIFGEPLQEEPGVTEKNIVKFLGILLIPLLLSAYGFVRLWLRRRDERLLPL